MRKGVKPNIKYKYKYKPIKMTHACIDCKREVPTQLFDEKQYCRDCYFHQLVNDMKTPTPTTPLSISDMRFQIKERIYMEKMTIEKKIKELNAEMKRLETEGDSICYKPESEIQELYSKL
jgi:hypothetical protein